jgi:hypothetical protein
MAASVPAPPPTVTELPLGPEQAAALDAAIRGAR